MLNEEIIIYIKTMVFNVTSANRLEKEKVVQDYGILFLYMWEGHSLENVLIRFSNINNAEDLNNVLSCLGISQTHFDTEIVSIFLEKCRNAKRCLNYIISKYK